MKTQIKLGKPNTSRFFILLLFVLTISSCVAVKFKTVQPQNAASMSSFPNSLLGKYIDNESDTMIITKCCFDYGNENSGFSDGVDSLVKGELELTKLDDYFVLNHFDETGWIVILIKQKADGFSAYHIEMDSLKEEIQNIEDEDIKEKMVIDNIRKISPVQKIKEKDSDDHYYLVNPTPDQLRKMIKAGLFVEINEFRRI